MYTCSYSSNPIYLPFDASPSEHVNIFYFTLNYRDFANYRFRKLQISQTADFANYRFRKLQISQITDFANCRFRFVSFRFVNYSKPSTVTSTSCPSPKKRKRPKQTQSFVDSWLTEQQFSGWLTKRCFTTEK